MKKLLVFIFAVILACSTAMADEIDLSGMSYQELLKLKDQVNLAIWNCDEWQSVTVPTGVYLVGRDIPAGKWVIKPAEGHTAYVYYGMQLSKNKMELNMPYVYEQITSPKDSYFQFNNVESVTWELQEGYYIVIEASKVVFETYAGLGFSFK